MDGSFHEGDARREMRDELMVYTLLLISSPPSDAIFTFLKFEYSSGCEYSLVLKLPNLGDSVAKSGAIYLPVANYEFELSVDNLLKCLNQERKQNKGERILSTTIDPIRASSAEFASC
ncbi:5'-3' exonuclease family protein [Actinidia rufa]|uniref:5'-3' exonuclease family protein n=1 Tax=Actinidia rufa TaxID=165716 RepID=A0A7J0EFU6_9ERIC|nr:5'-3' exonuclease family protein [Actinidia rufa]